MSAKINIQIQEKKWSKVDLRKLSKKAFKSTFKILSYPQLFKFLEVSILACNDKKIKEFLESNNPWALKDIAERFIEIINRKMWIIESDEIKETLKTIIISIFCSNMYHIHFDQQIIIPIF